MSIVLQALVAGATALASAGGSAAGKDLYERLAAAVRSRLGRDEDDEVVAGALAGLESRPDSHARQGLVGELLADADADDDAELLELAQRLLGEVGVDPGAVQAVQHASGRNVVQQVGDGRAAIVDRSRNR